MPLYGLSLTSEVIKFLFLCHLRVKWCFARSKWCFSIEGVRRLLIWPSRRGPSTTEEVTTSWQSSSTSTYVRPGRRTATEAKPHTPSKTASHTSPSTKSIRHIYLLFFKLFQLFSDAFQVAFKHPYLVSYVVSLVGYLRPGVRGFPSESGPSLTPGLR
jgi:hypothetical protein